MKRIEEELYKFYSDIPPEPNPEGMDILMKQLKNKERLRKRYTIPFWKFYFSQFQFIRTRVWVMQFIILLLAASKLRQTGNANSLLAWVSSLAPLVMLTGINEMFRTHVYGTYEMELSTFYTSKQVMLARASMIGSIDIICITLLMIMSIMKLSYPRYFIFLYILVPFLITCFGCLWIMNHMRGRDCIYYCYGLGLGIMAAVVLMTLYSPYLFIISAIWIWIILLIVSTVGIIREIYCLSKNYDRKLDGVLG